MTKLKRLNKSVFIRYKNNKWISCSHLMLPAKLNLTISTLPLLCTPSQSLTSRFGYMTTEKKIILICRQGLPQPKKICRCWCFYPSNKNGLGIASILASITKAGNVHRNNLANGKVIKKYLVRDTRRKALKYYWEI